MASNVPATTTIQPLEYAKETILGMTLSLEQRFGVKPRNDTKTTLNSKFGVYADRIPAKAPVVKYFCWGVGGRQNDSTSLSSAQFAQGTNMALYGMRPFRAVPVEKDLSAAEMKNYAMRRIETINGEQYALYYLKLIDFTQSQVQYTRTDPGTGIVTPYDLSYENLSPVPPVSDDNGVIVDISDQISVLVPGVITLTGQEVLESMSVIDKGDPRFAIASELGFVSANTESVSGLDFNGSPFPYDEAIMAQMVDQYNWVGQPFMSITDSWNRTMNFSMKNVINQS